MRSPPARFKYSGAGSESVESEAEAEEEMFLQANQLEEERGAEPFCKAVMIQMGCIVHICKICGPCIA